MNKPQLYISKLSTRFFIIILTFVIGIFAVAGWFYYQKSQPNQVLVLNAHQDSLLFNGVSGYGGINKVTELSEVVKLREVHLQKGDIEVRVWRGFGLLPLEGVVLKRTAGQWSGLHITTNNYYEPEKAEVKALYPPQMGWESFWQQLVEKEILTLPQTSENGCDFSNTDGIGYLVEINQDKIYRYYFYQIRREKQCYEAERMKDIGDFIGQKLYSGKTACKMGSEWLFCIVNY